MGKIKGVFHAIYMRVGLLFTQNVAEYSITVFLSCLNRLVQEKRATGGKQMVDTFPLNCGSNSWYAHRFIS